MKHLLTLVLIITFFHFGVCQNRESDSLVLVSIYESLAGDTWTQNENWLSDRPLEEWSGIATTNNRVTKLDIRSSASAGSSGDFPIQVLDLSELKTFELNNINIDSEIPESLIQLTQLERLVFKYCNLNGNLPTIFDQFSNLRTLVLSFNELTGPLPALPQQMSLVYIDRNQFSGPIPESWTGNEMSNLQIHGNLLTGNYEILTTLPNLNSMNLSDNEWDEHSLPLWIDDIPNLDRFTCENCNITGEIPSEIDFTDQENYSGMFLSNNKISGDISLLFNNPIHEKNMFLRVRNNKFSGELPVHKIASFYELDVYGNSYTSMTSPKEGEEFTLDILFNNFNYESLSPVEDYITLDSIIGVKYWNQNIYQPDTSIITSQTTFTIHAGDDHPNTTYQWYKSNQIIESETESSITLDVSDNNQSGSYQCRMSNLTFPELQLRSNISVLEVDISTATENVLSANIVISPNPADQRINFSGLNGKSHQYVIRNTSGQHICSGTTKKSIDISGLNSGTYLVSTVSEGKVTNQKFIKL